MKGVLVTFFTDLQARRLEERTSLPALHRRAVFRFVKWVAHFALVKGYNLGY